LSSLACDLGSLS